jgi:hypothetical protein
MTAKEKQQQHVGPPVTWPSPTCPRYRRDVVGKWLEKGVA